MTQKESPTNSRTLPNGGVPVAVLWCGIGCCVASFLTLPFMKDCLWIGEIPLLAIFQIPKMLAIQPCRHVMMESIKFFGLSDGSSHDYHMASLYALAIVYLIPITIIVPVCWIRLRPLTRWPGLLVIAFLVAAVIDYVLTLIFGSGCYY